MTDQLDRLKAALADRYVLERELGAGGMATVYLADDPKHHRKVALKVLQPDLAATLGPERFLREVTIAANLQHPHILPVYDSGEVGGFLYYVMPYVEGESLRERLAKRGELPLTDAVRILRDVADAMAAAHAKGVVHRDIKPENIMLSGRHALVADFGVAKAVSEATGRQTLTTAGVALGTPTYMAPEQGAADPHTDHRADLYAFGVTAYEMLTGQPPFMRATPQAVLAAHVTEAPVNVTQRRGTIPAPLALLIMRCLEKKPADRPQSAEELLPVLEGLATPSGGVTPTETVPVTATSIRPRSLRVWTAGAAVLAVAALGIAAATLLRRSPDYVVDRVLAIPFESDPGDTELVGFGQRVVTDIVEAATREGLGDVVPLTTVRDLVGRTRGTSAEVAEALSRETGAGVVVGGNCERGPTGAECHVELLRMPGRVQRGLSVTVQGTAGDPAFERDVVERTVVLLQLQHHWGDRASWQGEYIPESPEAVREFNQGFDRWTTELLDTSGAEYFRRAAQLDTAWVEAAVMAEVAGNWRTADSTLAAVASRPGLSAVERDLLEMSVARQGREVPRYYELVQRRFRANPELWLFQFMDASLRAGHSNGAVAAFALADSVPRIRAGKLARINELAGWSLHHLGRHREEVELAGRMRERFPGNLTAARTVEIMGRAGLGDVEGVRRVVAESEATPEAGSGPSRAGTRAYIAAIELASHGHEPEGRDLALQALQFYRGQYRPGTWPYSGMMESLIWLDEFDEARSLLRQAPLQSAGDSMAYFGYLTLIAAVQGEPDEASRYREQVAALGTNPSSADYLTSWDIAIDAALGQREAAVLRLGDWMRSGCAMWTNQCWPAFVHRSFLDLLGYPPFEQLFRTHD